MNDIEYIYRQDIREKKSTGRGIYGKKSGARTKYVSLPQDKLTDAQLKRRNSPVYTYNINTCIHDWNEFKNLPTDLQKTYLTNVLATYNPTLGMIAKEMGVSDETLRSFIHRKGFDFGLKRGGHTRTHPWWNAFICDNRTTLGAAVKPSEEIIVPLSALNDAPPADEPKPEDEPAVVHDAAIEDSIPDRLDAPSVYKFSVSMEGTAMQLYTMLAMLTDSKERYEFELSVKGGAS